MRCLYCNEKTDLPLIHTKECKAKLAEDITKTAVLKYVIEIIEDNADMYWEIRTKGEYE